MSTTKFYNATTNNTLELCMFDDIGADFFGNGITAAMVKDALSGDYKNVVVRINSYGGDAFEGIAIYNLLQSNGKPVNVIVDGVAASAASIIAMAGETVTMNAGTQMMIHNAMTLGVGNATDLRKVADTLDTVSSGIADIYVNNTELDKDTILEMMEEETWMNPEEAKAKGFATAIGQNAKVNNAYNTKFKFKNVPKELLVENAAKTKEVDGEHLTAEDFVYAGNPNDTSTWSLPWKFSTAAKTESHLRDALARFDQDKVVPKAQKDEVYAKLVRLCKQHGIKVDEADNAADTKLAAAGTEDVTLALRLKQVQLNKRK